MFDYHHLDARAAQTVALDQELNASEAVGGGVVACGSQRSISDDRLQAYIDRLQAYIDRLLGYIGRL